MKRIMYQMVIDLAASILFAALLNAQSEERDKIAALVAFVISFAVLTLRPFITALLNKRVVIK